jgi:hypothetical protein
MHHTLRFYARYQHSVLKYYLALARLTTVPLIGLIVRRIANIYGISKHHGYILTLQEAESIVDISTEVVLGPCSCREVSHNCDTPVMTEILVGSGPAVFPEERDDGFSAISKEKAKEILRECNARKLLHTLVNCNKDYYAICNCCTCCCVPLRLRTLYKINSVLIRDSNIVENFRNNVIR